ncbi:MAG: AMP-binding protein, partial [Burkholderiales bacterium]|nr:AMP-binding protein [Burkholderiales bacterium]
MNDKTALVNVLKNRSVLMGTDVAYIFITATGETKITYSELDARARVVAGMLQEYCAYKERVLLLLEPGLDYIVALWGCLYAGAIAIPAYQPRNSHHMQRLEAIIEDSKAAFVFKAKTTLADFSFPIKELFLDQITAEYQEVSISLNDIAFLQYTSGSTDKPKGVIVSHGNIVANLNTLNHLLSPILNPQNVGCSWLPPYHDMGLIGGILLPIYIGFPMFLMSPLRFVQSPFSWLKLISDKKIDIGVAPNFAYEMCVNNISDTEMLDLDLSSCKALFNASEPIVVESVQSFIDKFSKVGLKTSAILPAYGMAEATLIISGIMATTKFSTVNLVKDDFQKGIVTRCTNSNQNSVKKIGCGKPDIFHNILIVDPSSNSILPPDSIGEICFSGPSVAQGYWRQDKLTKAVFKNYFLNDSISYLRSGDLGFLDSNNELYVIGRIKEVVIINGRNIYPHDICMSISYSHSSLVKHSSAVFGIEINGKEQLIIIQEIKRHIEHYSDIFEAILNKVALEYEVIPAQILLIGAAQLPKTSSGKIQHLAAKTAFLNKELKIITKWIPQSIDEQRKNNGFTLPVVPPSSIDQIYKGLANYIADYYNLDSNLIEKDRSFIYFGCDSIMITIFAADISKWLNIEIIPPEIWENNSLSKLTSYIGIK